MNDCIFYTEFQDGHATIIDCKLRDDGATYPKYYPECKNCIMHTTAREAAELVRQKRGISMDSPAKQR